METIQTIQSIGPELAAFIIGVYLILVIILRPRSRSFKIPFINVSFLLPKTWWQRTLVVLFGIGFMVPYGINQAKSINPGVEVVAATSVPTGEVAEILPTEMPEITETPQPIILDTGLDQGSNTDLEPVPVVTQIQVLYEEDFLDNHNDWLVQENAVAKSYFLGGEYIHRLSCPESEGFYFCSTFIRIPAFTEKNYRIEFDASVERSDPSAVAGVSILVRQTDNGNYYFGYRTNALYSIYLFSHNNYNYFIENQPMSGYRAEMGEINRYGAVVNGTNLKALVNGVELYSFEDGNINVPGDAKIVLIVSNGSTATFKLDNLLITEP